MSWKKIGQVRLTMTDNNGDTFIAILNNVPLATDLCDRLFSIITLLNSGHTCFLHKGFSTVYLGAKDIKVVTLPHSAQSKHTFLGEIKEMSKTKKLPSRKKIALEFVHQRLGDRSTKSLMAGYTANLWEYIDLRIDTDPFCT